MKKCKKIAYFDQNTAFSDLTPENENATFFTEIGRFLVEKGSKLIFFVKIVDFGPKTLLMTKNDLSIAIIKEKNICGVMHYNATDPIFRLNFLLIRF